MPKRRQVVTRDPVSGSATLGQSVAEDSPPSTKPFEPTGGDDPLSETNLKSFFNDIFTLADEARKPRETVGRKGWDLYNNVYDWSDKAWWQSKAPIPKVRQSVDKAVGIFRKTLLRLNPFFGTQAESKLGKQKGNFTLLLTDYWFDQSAAIEAFVTAFKCGLITGTSVVKIWWQTVRDFKPELEITSQEVPITEFGVETGVTTEEKRDVKFVEHKKGKLGIAAVDSFNFWVVPNSNLKIERTVVTLDSIMVLTEGKDPIYIKEAALRLRDRSATKIEDIEAARRKGEAPPLTSAYIKTVELFHVWGDIYDKTGRVAMANGSFTMADKDILLRKARPNPFYHKQAPYVIGSPYLVPFSTYNRGMVEDVYEIAKNITELANVIFDGGLYDALKAFAIDADQLDDPSEAKQGLYPGKTYVKNGNKAMVPGQKLIETVDVGKIPDEAMNAKAMFEQYYAEGTYMNEWVSGQGGRTGRTLGEVNIKTQSALEGLDESARNLEISVLEPGVEMAAKVIYQFHEDFTLPRLIENYPQVALLLQQMSPAERYATMIGGFSFKVRGLSIMVDQAQQMGEVKEILTLLSYLPGALEALNQGELLEKIFAPMGWDTQKLLMQPPGGGATIPTAGAKPQPPNPQMILQMLMQAAQQGGAGGGARNSMQKRNASEGARMGGNRNNPGARR